MLVPCDHLLGRVTIFDHDPQLTTHRDVLYVPTGRVKRDEGLFDRGSSLIHDAGYFRAHPEPVSLYSLVNPLSHERFDHAPDDCTYLYLGAITGHYGHFITGSLARLWAIETFDPAKTKLVVLNHGPVSTLFEIPWIRDILSAFGIEASHVVNFAKPTRFREIIVPAPAFEEGNLAHRIFGRCCGEAGKKLAGPTQTGGKPIFLTKMHLKSGVGRVENEEALCERLHEAGVEIIAPEALSVKEQVRLFEERPVVAGMAGSALHTAIFAPGRVKVELHVEPHRLSNQALLDGANGGSTVALFPKNGIERVDALVDFQATYRFVDPRKTAEDLLRAMGI